MLRVLGIPRSTFQQLVALQSRRLALLEPVHLSGLMGLARSSLRNPTARPGERSTAPTPAGFGTAGALRNRPPRPPTGKTRPKNAMISKEPKSGWNRFRQQCLFIDNKIYILYTSNSLLPFCGIRNLPLAMVWRNGMRSISFRVLFFRTETSVFHRFFSERNST